MKSSVAILARFHADEQILLDRLVTENETWLHLYDLESRDQSMKWNHKGSVTPSEEVSCTKVIEEGVGVIVLGQRWNFDGGLPPGWFYDNW